MEVKILRLTYKEHVKIDRYYLHCALLNVYVSIVLKLVNKGGR